MKLICPGCNKWLPLYRMTNGNLWCGWCIDPDFKEEEE